MKGSLITSVGLHALLAGWLLFSFAPAPLEVTMSEALPVDLVPIEEMTQLQQGDEKAEKKEKSATSKTKRDDVKENAENTGDNDFDLKSVPTPVEKPSNVQEAGAEKSSKEVIPDQKITKAENVEDILKEDTAIEPTQEEVAAIEQPKVEVKPEPKPVEEVKQEVPVEQAVEEPIPDNVPVPESRPKVMPKKVEEKKEEPKEVKVAEAKPEKQPDRKKSDKNTKSAKSTTTKETDFNTDEIAQELSKVDTKAGGTKRSKTDKSFGAKKATGGEKLSQDEYNALKGLIEKNWTIMPGQVTSNDIVISVTFQLDENGDIVGDLEVKGSGGEDSSRRALEGGAKRAVMKSAPFDKLPKDKYETWSEVTVNFRPSEIM
jgi:hypothetical protein